MAVVVKFVDKGKGVEIVLTGQVRGSEILRELENVYHESHIRAQQYHIIDKSKCTEYNVTYEEVEAIANLNKKASKTNSNIIMAIIESETLLFRLTELWQMHVDNYVCKSQAFDNRNNAIEWINKNIV